MKGKLGVYILAIAVSFPLYYLMITNKSSLGILVLNFLLGVYLLAAGSDYFVDGASGIATHFKVSEHTIGLTLVAVATSLPELAVSDIASFYGYSETAWGNVVGSNIANIGIVLGIAALIMPLRLSTFIKRDSITLSLITTLLILFAIIFRGFFWWIGLVFLIIYGIYVNDIRGREEEEPMNEKMSFPIAVLSTVFGATGIVWGADILVKSAIGISLVLGIPQIVIAITAVAIGTSLPELATTITATLKKKHGIAVGNIIGSNIFNTLVVLGTAAIIHPIYLGLEDLFLSLASLSILTYLLTAYGFRKKLGKIEGISFLLIYTLFIFFLIVKI